MADGPSIPQNPQLSHDQDYNYLFQAGLDYISELGSAIWTDYNEHDPGITILEALCYSITELGYRTSLPMEDLLTDSKGSIPFDAQTLFSPKKILTQSPLTVDDYRKLLIDIEGVSNAWLHHNAHYKDNNNQVVPTGEVAIYADCKNDTFTFGAKPDSPSAKEVFLRGLYSVLLELDDDPQLGDLNNGDVEIHGPGGVDLIFSFPGLKTTITDSPALLTVTISDATLTGVTPIDANSITVNITLPAALIVSVPAGITIRQQSSGAPIGITEITNFFTDPVFCKQLLNLYLQKIQKADTIVGKAIRKLSDHRNLCEDFVSISIVDDEDISFCFDIDVASSADMPAVQAKVFFAIDQYLNPPVNFYLLGDMVSKGYSIDEIFDGPRLEHGFIDTKELENTDLRKTIYASEIIAAIMKIPEVQSVRNFLMSAFLNDNPVAGEVDRSWCIDVLPMHKPILNKVRSNITFYKNQFPYSANLQQTSALLDQMLQQEESNKLTSRAADPVSPKGGYFPLDSYTSLQYLFPVTYGIGETTLPDTATGDVTTTRIAQARQLKGYLLFYDQLLADFLAQLKNAGSLFSTEELKQTYHAQYISGIHDIENIYTSSSASAGSSLLQSLLENQDSTIALPNAPNPWEQLYESNETYINRRNRFLDHLLARFAESFSNYVFLMYSLDYSAQEETKTDPADLINSKIKFLKDYPRMGYRRDCGYNYYPQRKDFSLDTDRLWDTDNVSGLEEKLCLLGGFRDDEAVPPGTVDTPSYYRRDLYPSPPLPDLTQFPNINGLHLVEHILLRPRRDDFSPPYCSVDHCCDDCGDDDPYSFRVTIVLPYWPDHMRSMAFRDYLEQTIRTEIPAHIMVKICWVDQVSMVNFETAYKAWIIALANYKSDGARLPALKIANDALLKILFDLYNVYPAAILHDCSDSENTTPVVLNRTILGTEK